MAIRYALYPNRLRNQKESNSYLAKVRSQGNYSLKKLIKRMTRPGIGVSDSAAVGVLNAFFGVMEEVLKEGYTISTPLFHIKPVIKGPFIDYQDYFKEEKNTLHFSISAGNQLKELPEGLSMRKVNPVMHRPAITRLFNAIDKTSLNQIVGGDIIGIGGYEFYVNGDEQSGVYFVADNGIEKQAQYVTRLSSYQLLVGVPIIDGVDKVSVKVISKLPRHTKPYVCRSPILTYTSQ